MPVKFRCQHCKQLLGISHKKIGQVVDCPKCGRSVKVPAEDGIAAAPPKPEFNLEDSALVRALDELAAIGQQKNSALASPVDEADEVAIGDDEDAPMDSANRSSVKGSWLPTPGMFNQEPPLPAEKVETPPAPPVIAPVVPSAPPPPTAPLAAPIVVGGPPAPPSSSANWREIAAIAPAGAAPTTAMRAPSPASTLRLMIAIAAVGGFLGGLIVGFGAGYLLRPAQKPVEAAAVPAGKPEEKPEPQAAGILGKISYKTESGEKRPDEGARLLILPENRTGTLKISAVGLRLGDHDVDQKAAIATVRALGGDVAIAGIDGQFSTTLAAAGNYHVIVVSSHQAAEKDAVVPENLKLLLSAYMDKPEDFIGQRAVHYEQVRYKGAGTDPWDYTFAAP